MAKVNITSTIKRTYGCTAGNIRRVASVGQGSAIDRSIGILHGLLSEVKNRRPFSLVRLRQSFLDLVQSRAQRGNNVNQIAYQPCLASSQRFRWGSV